MNHQLKPDQADIPIIARHNADFGHWTAHKLESLTLNRLRHGEAVAIGMAVDTVYSVKAGLLKATETRPPLST